MTVRDNALHLYDSLSRKHERFVPLTPGHVGIYVCGPTVYSDSHLGHAKSYVSFDVIVRYLRWLGYRVRYVQNITDVGHLTDNADEGEDKLQKRARLDQVHPLELAETYTRLYFRDMDALRVKRPDISPRATQHIPEQLEMIEELVRRGNAYVVQGSVYFAVTSFPEYGALSGRTLEEAEEGHRVQVRSDKRDPRDFALWKVAEGGHILRWKSPYGAGFPGWHIECSAMSSKYLGETFDIHGGGLDNQFPHHECEIAQSRAAGHGFARYWLHNNLVNVDGQKMSKSLGNFTSIEAALARHAPEVIRFWILSTHYRQPVNYSTEGLSASKTGLERLSNCFLMLKSKIAAAEGAAKPADPDLVSRSAETLAAFQRAMDDDFNTPVAIAALFDFVRTVNAAVSAQGAVFSKGALESALSVFEEAAGTVLDILPGDQAKTDGSADSAPLIEFLIEMRARAKARKDFETGDLIRTRLTELGIELKDSKDGTAWSRKS